MHDKKAYKIAKNGTLIPGKFWSPNFLPFPGSRSEGISDIEQYGINMLKHQLGELANGHSMEEVRENIKHKKLFGNRYISRDAYHKENTALCKSLNT